MVPIHTQAPKRGGIKEINLSKAFVHGLGTLAVDLQRKGETSSHVKAEDLGWSSLSEKKRRMYCTSRTTTKYLHVVYDRAWAKLEKGTFKIKKKIVSRSLLVKRQLTPARMCWESLGLFCATVSTGRVCGNWRITFATCLSCDGSAVAPDSCWTFCFCRIRSYGSHSLF